MRYSLHNWLFQKLAGSRRSLYETVDKPVLKSLPVHRYEFAEWRKAKVNIDYHVEVDHNCYSVPYQLVHHGVDVRLTAESVGAHTGQLVARLLEAKPHPDQGYRSSLGIMRLSKTYGAQRMEAAASRALACGA